MTRTHRHAYPTARTLAVAVVLASTLAACGSGGGGNSDSGDGATSDAAGKTGPVTFWGWAPGYQEAADAWNASHPDEQVTFETIEHSDYTKMVTAVKAGNAPCLAQVEYKALPDMVVQKVVADISDQVGDAEGDFVPAAWQEVAVGEGVYGVPVDTAPLAFLYNKEALASYGITEPPATWEQYKADAEKVKAADPGVSLGYISDEAGFWSSIANQNGANWFTLNDNSWSVTIDDDATQQAAAFWQTMIDDKTLPVVKSYTPALYKQMSEGKILSETLGIWDAALLSTSLSEANSGKWAVAPAPTWEAYPDARVDNGGSATSILNGCDNMGTAIDFATWMSTSADAWPDLIKVGGLWPASLTGLESPVLQEPVPFYGNEPIYRQFVDIAKESSGSSDWLWGPTMDGTNKAIQDGIDRLASGETTLPEVFSEVNQTTIDDIKARGLTVE